MSKLLIHTWTAYKKNDDFFLPYMHWVYLNEIQQYFTKVYIVVPVGEVTDAKDLVPMQFPHVEILAVPFYSNYKGATKTFFHYVKHYNNLPPIDVAYSRYPAPFGWLQKIFLNKKERIIHYVGDPIDAARNNPNFSKLKKVMLTSLFAPENKLFEWACKGANIYTNGFRITEMLDKKNIQATPLISSTLRDNDFYFEENKNFKDTPKLIYIGYLRTAKGVETIIKAFNKFLVYFPKATLSVVGEGEHELELKKLAKQLNIDKNVVFYGFIDDRERLNRLLRSHHLFCFGSLSEGSPRVILEAMANGLNVLSTPVGSLPYVFNDYKELVFANFNDVDEFSLKMKTLFEDVDMMKKLRLNAYNKVKDYTIRNFIKTIFDQNNNDEEK